MPKETNRFIPSCNFVSFVVYDFDPTITSKPPQTDSECITALGRMTAEWKQDAWVSTQLHHRS